MLKVGGASFTRDPDTNTVAYQFTIVDITTTTPIPTNFTGTGATESTIHNNVKSVMCDAEYADLAAYCA